MNNTSCPRARVSSVAEPTLRLVREGGAGLNEVADLLSEPRDVCPLEIGAGEG